MYKFAGSLVAVILLSSWSFAQDCTAHAVVAAYDRKSADTVDNLQTEDFEAFIGGKWGPVLEATQQFRNRVLVLLETDGRRSDRVNDAVSLATRLTRQTPAGKPTAFGAFAKRAVFTEGFIDDEKKRATSISAVIEEADTLGNDVALYNALHKALSLFGPHQPGDTVVLISDGYDDDSNHSGGEVEREFLDQGTRLIMMFRQQPSRVMGNFITSSPEHDRALLQEMSNRTGGIYTMFDAYSFSQASHGYLLSVRLPQGAGKPVRWKLRIRRGSGIDPHRVQLHYPEKLRPCSVAAADARAKNESAPE